MIEVFKITNYYVMKQLLFIFLPEQELILEAITANLLIISFIIIYASIFIYMCC